MRLSVIVPCYNVEGYVTRCIESLVHQDLSTDDYEVLLVDDGSTDGTGAICDRYAAQYPQVKVIHQPNGGLSAARNAGLDAAQGDYIYLVDGDDFVVENRLGKFVATAEKHNLDTLGFNTMDFYEGGEMPTISEFDECDVNVVSGAEYLSQNSMQGPVWWYMTKRELIETEKLRFPVGHMLEDAPYTPNVILASKRIAKVNQVGYFYVQRASSIMHDRDKAHFLKMLDEYIFAYHSVDEVIEKHRSKLDDSALKHLCSRRDSYLYFGIVRAMKAGVLKEYYAKLKADGIFPLKTLDNRDFPGIKWKMMKIVFNCPLLMRCIGGIYKTLK